MYSFRKSEVAATKKYVSSRYDFFFKFLKTFYIVSTQSILSLRSAVFLLLLAELSLIFRTFICMSVFVSLV